MKNGKLDMTEIRTLFRAVDILVEWHEYHSAEPSKYTQYEINDAKHACQNINGVLSSIICNEDD